MVRAEISAGKESLVSFLAMAIVAFRLQSVQGAISAVQQASGVTSLQQWFNLIGEDLTDEEIAFVFEFFYRLPGSIPEELSIIFAAHPEAEKHLDDDCIAKRYREYVQLM